MKTSMVSIICREHLLYHGHENDQIILTPERIL